MSSAGLIFDTETTGIDLPHVIELAYTEPFGGPLDDSSILTTHSQRYWTPKRIDYGAMATHHILPRELDGQPTWPGSWAPPPSTGYLVGHNVDFDWEAIGKPDLKRICTLALSRFCWPDVDSHRLDAMSYFHADNNGTGLEAMRELLKGSHSASVDVARTYDLMKAIALFIGPEAHTWEGLWRASEKARVPLRMTFGKYGPYEDWAKTHNDGKGMFCSQVRHRDPGYYRWLLNSCDQVKTNPYLLKALTGAA